MEIGKCKECINKAFVDGHFWCKAHNKLICLNDLVVCGHYRKNII